MSDDLCNDWGCDLVCMGRLSGRKRKTGTMITILADDRRHNNFHRLIEKTTNGSFGLMKLTTNGSDANLYAVTSMTKGNNSGCLIGCGSYVSGDSGPLQSWSTSDFEIGSGPAGIIGPDDPKLSSFTLQHTNYIKVYKYLIIIFKTGHEYMFFWMGRGGGLTLLLHIIAILLYIISHN